MAVNLVGRDKTSRNYLGYQCKEDHVYRAIDEREYQKYLENACVMHPGKDDYIPGENNGGIDWYLGAVGDRYVKNGGYIVEAKYDSEHFQVARGQLARDGSVSHIKSGNKNPVPVVDCKIMSVDEMRKGNYEDVKPDEYKRHNDVKPVIERPSEEEISQAKKEAGIEDKEPDFNNYTKPEDEKSLNSERNL